MPEKKLTLEEFGKKVKTKYPEYKDMPDAELATKMLAKYPEYVDMVEVKKKVQSGNSTMENGGLGSEDPLKNPPPSKYQYVDPQTFDEANLPEAKFQPPTIKTNPFTNKPFNSPAPKEGYRLATDEEVEKEGQRVKQSIENQVILGGYKKPLTSKQDLDAQLSKVNQDLIDKEEEFVVPQLKQQFGDLGFKFEETGIGDAVKVTAPNGQKLTVNLDPFTSKTEKGQAEELKKFIRTNAKPDKLTRLMANQDKYNQKIISEEEVKNSILTIRQEETQMASQYQKLAEDQQLLSNAKIRKGLMERKGETNTQEYQDVAKYVADKEAYVDRLQSQLRGVQNKHDKNKSALDASVGKFHRMQKEQGTFGGGLRNEVLSGLDDIVYGATDVEIDLMFWLSDKEKKEAKKQVKPAYKPLLGSENTTEKYVEGADVIPGAIMSLGRSAPPMLAGNMMLPLMFLQSSAGLSKEMNNNPAFNDINEYEKRAITAPIALAEAMLEKLGFEGAMGKSKYVNNLVKRALDDTTVETGVDGLTEILKRNIDSDVVKGILVVGKGAVKGGLSEGATGGMQEISNITGKELYNAIKGKPMFETPKTFWDGVKQVGEAARDEAIGGMILGAVGSVSEAYSKDKLSKIDTKDVVALNAIGNNMEMMDAIESDVQIKVNTGAITPEEGKEQVDAVRNTIGLLNNLPDNLTAEQQKEALPLVQKLRDLEDEKERAGKAKGIVEPIQLKIDAINEKLVAIIKKPKPKDSPAPPATGGSMVEVETSMESFIRNHPVTEGYLKSTEDAIKTETDPDDVKWNEEYKKKMIENPVGWADDRINSYNEDIKDTNDNPSGDTESDKKLITYYQEKIQELENFKKDIQNEINPKEKPKETETEAQAEPITNEQAEGQKDEVVETPVPENVPEEGVRPRKVYHGAVNEFTIEGKKNRIMFTSNDKKYANYYAKERGGKVFEFDIDESKIAKEDYVKEKIKALGLKTENGEDVEVEDNLHRLIDLRFDDTSISKEGLDKLFSELEKEGYYGVDFMDENQESGGRNQIESTAIFNPKELIKPSSPAIEEDIMNDIGEDDVAEEIRRIEKQEKSPKEKPKAVTPKKEVSPKKTAPKKSPTKSPETKNLEKELLEAQSEVSMINGHIKAKAAEMAKSLIEDQSDIFGDRKSDKGKLFSQRINPDKINKVIKDLKAKRDAAILRVRAIQDKLDGAAQKDTGTKDIFESKQEDTPKKQPKKKPSIVENLRKKYGKLDQINQRTLVLRFFATGGRINLKEAIARTGVKARDLFGTTAKNGTSYHSLYENVTDELGLGMGDIDQGDFDNMVDAMLMGPKSDIYKEINSHLEPENKQDANDPNDPANWTYEDLQIALRSLDPMYHDYIIEKINEFEQSFSNELFEQEKAEIDRILLENTDNGVIDWETVSTNENIQQLIIEQNETNNIPTEKTSGDKKSDSSDIGSKEDGREGQVNSYSDNRYNSTISVGERYYDSRYGDYYEIVSMTPFGDEDVTVAQKYDKGKEREEKGSFILYHIDSKQHTRDINQVNEPPSDFKQTNQLELSFISQSGNKPYPVKEKKESKGETFVQAVWNKYKHIPFFGTTKVKDASDVAHIMKSLEDKSIEHAFAVYVDGKGNSHIQYISTGSVVGTVFGTSQVIPGALKFKAKKVYLVHNHPSGNMVPSAADKEMTTAIRNALQPLNISLEHVIMDTYDNKYVHIDYEGNFEVKDRDLSKTDNIELEVSVMDEQKVLTKSFTKVVNSQSVAEFLQQLKFTAMPKHAVLILNQRNEIIANYVYKNKINLKETLEYIAGTGIGRSVILYGNQVDRSAIRELGQELREAEYKLLDYVVTSSNGDSVKGYYESMADMGILDETQEKYGTAVVKEFTELVTPYIIKEVGVELRQKGIEGGLLNKQQAKDLEEKIIAIRPDPNDPRGMFDPNFQDIRQNVWNYDNPHARKLVNGVDIRIVQGLIEGVVYSGNRRNTYLLYADGKIVGKFYTVEDAKRVVKFIEGNLIKSVGENKLISEINSKPLTRAMGTGMGNNEMTGTFISTEASNRYAYTANTVESVKVDIKNPYLLKNADELIDLQTEALQRAKDKFALEYPEVNNYPEYSEAKYIDDEGLDAAYNLGLTKYIADQVTENLKSEGYDSAYLRESEDSEGMLVVFDKDNVKITKSKLTANEQIRRGIQKLKDIPNKGIARDITSLPAEVIEALADIAIGYARRGGGAMGEYVKFLRGKYKDYLKNVSDKELETLYKKANGIKEERKPGQVKKTIATIRAYEGDIRENVKKVIESLGLYRERESWSDAKARAKEFIEKVGYENALEAVRNNDVDGGAGAFIWDEILQNVNRQMLTETDPQKMAELEALQGKLFQEFSYKAWKAGSFGAALKEIYQSSDLGYNVDKKIKDWKEDHKGTITPDMEARFREIDRELKELKEKLAKAEEKAKEAEKRAKEAEAVAGIKESIEREKKQRVSAKIRQETDRLLKKVQEAKIHRPGMFMSATPASIIWDGAVNAVELSIKAGGRTAEAIAKGVEFIKGSAWYNGLTPSGQDQAIKEFEGWWKEKPKAEMVDGKLSIPPSLIRELVAGGIDNIEDLTEAIKQLVEVDVPGVTTREIRDAITDYGKVVNVNKEQIAMEIRKMKRIGRILSGLEDIAEKKRPLRSGMQRDTLDAQERALQKELREAMKELPLDAALEAEQQKTATDALKRRLKNQIEDLEREIAKGVQVPRSARTIQMDQEIQDLKDMLAAVKKRHDAVFKNEAYEAAKRLEMAKKRTTARIAELQRRIREKDFAQKKKVPIIEDTELSNLRAEKIRIQNKYDVEFYKDKLLRRGIKQKIIDMLWDFWGLLRPLRASFDLSFVLIQGLVQTTAHPLNAIKAFVQAAKNFASESATEDFLRGVKAQAYYPQLKQSKLALTEIHAEVTAREELFNSEWTNLIWDIAGLPFLLGGKTTYKRWSLANPFRALERAALGYLDTLRVLRWLDGKDMLEAKGIKQEENPQAWKDMADVINTLTGRASLGALEMIAPQLTKGFFSPRNWASVIKTASPYAFYYLGSKRAGAEGWKPSVAQKIALMDYVKFVGLTTSLMMLAHAYLSGDDDDETGVEFNPTSSDYLKIKLGNMRIDPWGGRQQEVVLTARLIAGALGEPVKKTDGRMVQLGTPHQAPTMAGLMGERVANKLSPSAAMLFKYLNTHVDASGKRVDSWGEDYVFTEELKSNLYPMYFDTANELLKDDPTALDGMLTFYALLGGSVNIYEQKGRGPRKRPVRPPKPIREDKP